MRRKFRILGCLTLALVMVLVNALYASNATSVKATPDENSGFYMAKVEYIIVSDAVRTFSLKPGDILELMAPPEPTGYMLKYFEVRCENGFPENIVPVVFDRKREANGKLTAIISRKDVIKLANNGITEVQFNARIIVTYVKEEWVPLDTTEILISVEEPEPPFQLSNLTVKFSIDNYAPYQVKDVIGPSGVSLTNSSTQEDIDPEAVGVDPKHVMLSFSHGLPEGEYRIVLNQGDEYRLPSAFLVVEEKFYNETIPAGGSKVISVQGRNDWQLIGYAVVLYSMTPEVNKEKGGMYIEAGLADFVYSIHETITAGGVSYLIPPINFVFNAKAYVVFSPWFKVVNEKSYPINMIYIPISIKARGEWYPNGVKIAVAERDIDNVKYAYLVVQIPSYGEIRDVKSPSGASLGTYFESTLPWGSSLRSISVFESEAYIQIKTGNIVEYGTYTIDISWKPLIIKAVDSRGKALANAIVEVASLEGYVTRTNASGYAEVKLYKPCEHTLAIKFKGKYVYETAIKTVTERFIEAKCKVYYLTVKATNFLGQPLGETEISIVDENGNVLDIKETGKDGIAVFEQIPEGTYQVVGKYKRVEKTENLELNGDMEINMKLNVLFTIPYVNVAVTVEEIAGLTIALTALLLAVKLISGKEEEEEEEEGEEEEEDINID